MSFSLLFRKTHEEHMLIAEITVGSCYGEAIIPVEILGKGPRSGTVRVQALNGLMPFTRFSHGGPTQDCTSTVLVPKLRDIHRVNDTGEELLETYVLQVNMETMEVG
jgi:hypothetical protein